MKNETESVNTGTVIAHWYVVGNGHESRELIALSNGMYVIAHNGRVPDARQKLTTEQAQPIYDQAAYKDGSRPSRPVFNAS